MGSSSPSLGVKIQKIVELPPPIFLKMDSTTKHQKKTKCNLHQVSQLQFVWPNWRAYPTKPHLPKKFYGLQKKGGWNQIVQAVVLSNFTAGQIGSAKKT